MRYNSTQCGTVLLGIWLTTTLMPSAWGQAPKAPFEKSVFSESLYFEGAVVEKLPSGLVIRETAFLRDKRFDWVGEAKDAAPEEVELPVDDSDAFDIDALSVEELAEHLRGIALFAGHVFRETHAPIELAVEIKALGALEGGGASAEKFAAILSGIPASQGEAEWTADFKAAEVGTTADKDSDPNSNQLPKPKAPTNLPPQGILQEGNTGPIGSSILFIVHGTDDRRVMNNRIYPHRTHIVFDNLGSTSSINGSQGSGTLIGPSTAMSVAHVFWHERNDTWETTHRWAPGYDSEDSDPSPYGEWYGCYWVTIPTAYTIYENSTYDFAVLDFNVGCNSVRNGVNSDRPGSTVGWLGSVTASTSSIESRTGFLRGYPGIGTCGNPATSCRVRVWGDTSRASENDARSNTIRHQADTSGGQSGSAFYHYDDPTCSGCGYGPYLVGMHRSGSSSYNEARRYNWIVYAFMTAYASDY